MASARPLRLSCPPGLMRLIKQHEKHLRRYDFPVEQLADRSFIQSHHLENQQLIGGVFSLTATETEINWARLHAGCHWHRKRSRGYDLEAGELRCPWIEGRDKANYLCTQKCIPLQWLNNLKGNIRIRSENVKWCKTE